ncbi:hypothetical protein GGS23DRAFT_79516 [Durotheca rogersii]|uniref:uncharacterized protein n=1 Tax=Durotheca rogersii TaxID=419775 RepID=UPI002220ADF2|nr:uncharacterized protein GGS23DRAFT_79516 [Durotheca rogersii]KAI5862510.1 hypothetical protein GGS23DRAFT_79516 [Durotheca rogersii]
MWDTRFQKKKVYLEWERIFSTFENSRLRKQKAIRAVVQRYDPIVLLYNPDVVKTLQALLKENIFQNSWAAPRAFPELFPSEAKPDTAPPQQPAGSTTQAVFGMDGPSKELLTSFKQLYARGEYADLVITCHGKQHQVHKAIVCPRSDFFAAACRGDMKEARTGIIDLPDDDPQVVDMMVYYFYHLDYSTPPLHIIKGKEVTDQMDTHGDGDDVTASRPCYSDLVVHAKIYALAGKYFIGGLKALALQKFEAATQKHWAPGDFLEAAQEVYTSTLDSDRGLRDAIVKTLFEHRDLLVQENTRGVLKRLDTLTYDLLMYVNQKVTHWR